MKTEVIMKRNLFDGYVRQNNQTNYFNVNDLMLYANRWRIASKMPVLKYDNWYNSSSTKEFLTELELNIGQSPIISKRGKTGERWVHPYAFLDLALYLSPTLKVEVYKWMFDELIKYRNNSGDSYKKMAGALYENAKNKSNFHRGISKTAQMIQKACKVDDWQKASEQQLKLRDKIHDNISLLCDVLRDNNQAIRIGILKSLEK
jgi:hypothetical protein